MIAILLPLSACQTSAPKVPLSPPPSNQQTMVLPSTEYLYGTANVESAETEIITGQGPTQMKLRIRGLLNDGATTIDQIQQTRVPDGFVVTVTTARLKNAMASLALVPFERVLTIDLRSIPSGPCQIRINDIRITAMVP